jgi:hypothetical protein
MSLPTASAKLLCDVEYVGTLHAGQCHWHMVTNHTPASCSPAPVTTAGGATIATLWLPLHMEYMRAHPDDGTGKGGAAAVMGGGAASMRKMLEQALQFEVRSCMACVFPWGVLQELQT